MANNSSRTFISYQFYIERVSFRAKSEKAEAGLAKANSMKPELFAADNESFAVESEC